MNPVFGLFSRILHPRPAPGSPGVYKAWVGDNFRSTHKTAIRNMGSIDQVRIGNSVTLLDVELRCSEEGQIDIGNEVRMGPGGRIISGNHIAIGNYCVFGREVSIRDTEAHPLDPPRYGSTAGSAPVKIGSDVWVGEGAVILKGVSLGNGCVVAPGSVVTQSFPAFSLVAGSPARFVRKVINIHA
jgi:acetyltransferase-like isoleucine patch superfamily enzyme